MRTASLEPETHFKPLTQGVQGFRFLRIGDERTPIEVASPRRGTVHHKTDKEVAKIVVDKIKSLGYNVVVSPKVPVLARYTPEELTVMTQPEFHVIEIEKE